MTGFAYIKSPPLADRGTITGPLAYKIGTAALDGDNVLTVEASYTSINTVSSPSFLPKTTKRPDSSSHRRRRETSNG
jgi:hypothetical protein